MGGRIGVTHEIHQGEGGEQGDPLMPLLSALGQHKSLVEAQARLRGNEIVFAYLDDGWRRCTLPSRKSSSPTQTSACIMGRHKSGTDARGC